LLQNLLLCGLQISLETFFSPLSFGELVPQLLVGVELCAETFELVLILLPDKHILESEHQTHLPDEVLQADDLTMRLPLTLPQSVELDQLLLELSHLLFKLSN
jgi:hypothetical protein